MKLRDLHQECIEIIEAIDSLSRKRNRLTTYVNGFAGTFPELRNKYLHQIDIADRATKRLKQRHDKKIIEILSLAK